MSVMQQPVRMSREDYKKAKELEELRKSGAVEPEKDEDGKDINPHIPQYIAQAPWYLNNNKPSLKHQRAITKIDYTKEWYRRGAKLASSAESFRKGACENCGAMTHQKKDCVERPRKVGAKFTNKDIQPDEVIDGGFVLTYDGRRDRWNGYDSSQYIQVMKEYEELEEARKKAKQEKVEEMLKSGKLNESDIAKLNGDDDDDAEDVKDENEKLVGQKFDAKTRTSVRNLRIREDTAKYLRNLDLKSAYYDPKTRSMRENPNPDLDPEQVDYAGDNFIRYSGDVRNLAKLQLYELSAHERSQDVHMLAAPTQAQYAHQQFREKKSKLQDSKQEMLLKRYGGEEHTQTLPVELKYGQSEIYVEYGRDGSLLRGQEAAVPKSKYMEDVLTNNHTTVWGSWWCKGTWGYACCHSVIRNSICTGEDGKAAASLAFSEMQALVKEKEKEKEQREKQKKEMTKQELLQQALEEEDVRAAEKATLNDRKRPYNSLHDTCTVTDEQMEAYYLRRNRGDDPMAKFLANPENDE